MATPTLFVGAAGTGVLRSNRSRRIARPAAWPLRRSNRSRQVPVISIERPEHAFARRGG
jgi:hypothetical protein